MKTATCDEMTEDGLLAFVAGDPGGEDSMRVSEHLGRCEGCREAAVELAGVRSDVVESCDGHTVRWHRFQAPFGPMNVAATHRGLARLTWDADGDDGFVEHLEDRFPDDVVVRDGSALAAAEAQLREYFAGERTSFELPVDLSRLSDFQRRVLRATREIGFGEVQAYGEVARRIGRPRAARAVGGALGRNPVAIVVPCHRVVRSDGSLGGYGGGVQWKERLLSLEGAELAPAG